MDTAATIRLPVAAKRLRVPEATLRAAITAGTLPAVKVKGRLLVRLADAENFAQSLPPDPLPAGPEAPPAYRGLPPQRGLPPVDVPTAARRAGVDITLVRRWLRDGRLRGEQVDGRGEWQIDAASLAELIRARAARP